MADRETREDKKIRECLQEAYGCSDAQLLKELEQAEKSVSDSDFAGAEDRIFKRIMERKAAQEKETETAEAAGQDEKPSPETVPEKKVVRFGKKRVFLAVALAAVFAGMLGSTAIGEKNYFFRHFKGEETYKTIIDNDANIIKSAKIEDAYEKIEEEIGVQALEWGYIPFGMEFDYLSLASDRAVLHFNYNENVISCVQMKRDKEISASMESDRSEKGLILNKWLNKEIDYNKNVLKDGGLEFEAEIIVENAVYYVLGKMEEEEFIKIIENLHFS